jgi:hypothetical protein
MTSTPSVPFAKKGEDAISYIDNSFISPSSPSLKKRRVHFEVTLPTRAARTSIATDAANNSWQRKMMMKRKMTPCLIARDELEKRVVA